MDIPSTEYTVKEGDDYKSIAEQHGIWEWWDLVVFNRHVDPATGKYDPAYQNPDADAANKANPDLLKAGDTLRIPTLKEPLAAGEKLLKDKKPPASLFQGKGYISVWGVLSFTLCDDKQQPLYKEGTPFRFHDQDGDIVSFFDIHDEKYKEQGKLDAQGGFEVELPRGSYTVEVQDEKKGWQRVLRAGPEAMQEARGAIKAPADFTPDQKQLVAELGVDALFMGAEVLRPPE